MDLRRCRTSFRNLLGRGNDAPHRRPQPIETIEIAREFLNWAIPYQLKNGFCRWAVVEKTSGEIVGSCGFARLATEEVEFGYLFARESWGKGFATQATSACLKHGYEKIGLTGIIALTDLDHEKSQNVLRKIGFHERGIEKTGDGEDMVFEFINQPEIAR